MNQIVQAKWLRDCSNSDLCLKCDIVALLSPGVDDQGG